MSRTYDDRMFRETFEHEFTWLNGFLRNVRRFGRRQALIDPILGRRWTYAQLDQEANRLAHAMRGLGIAKDDVVMTALQNCPVFAFSYIAPRKIGAILNPANFNLSPGELALLMDHNRPKIFLYSADIAKTAAKALELAHCKPLAVLCDNLQQEPLPQGHVTYEDLVAGQPDTAPEMDFIPHIYDEVLRLNTSGTTALPKNVPINDINEVLSAHDIIMQYPLDVEDVLLNMTPWFHRGGCHVGGPCPTFYVGACAMVMRTFQPRQSLQWVADYGVSYLIGAPSTLDMLSRFQEREHHDLQNLRGLVTMGAPFEKSACTKYMEVLTPNILNGYGTTETLCNCFLRPYDLPGHAGSAGRSSIDDEVRIVRAYEDRKAEPEETIPQDGETPGEIILWSPAKSTYCYHESEEMTRAKFYKGWMYTGDLGTWDQDSYITVCGRKDDMIVVSGENIYPTQVEEALADFDKVADSLVTCVPDKVRGQAVVAYVIPRDPGLTVKELKDFCGESPMLSVYKMPRYYRIVDSLPRTATGKKQHNVMKEQALRDLEAGLLLRS